MPSELSSGDRPHWAARIEDVKNRVVVSALRTMRWDARIQPYTGYGTPSRVRVLAKVLFAAPSAPADYHDQPVHDMRTMTVRGFRSFTSQCAPEETVTVELGGRSFRVRTDRTGIIDALLDVDLAPGVHQAVLSTHAGNPVTAEVMVFDPVAGHGVVSDIDDTVMVTWLPRPLLAFWNAFVVQQSTRKVVRGMPLLYQEIARQRPGTAFVYLSTGAWNVFPVLRRFLYKNGYPDGPMLLTDWGPTNTGLFRSGAEHKRRSIQRLTAMFPELRWILIGDNGQHDPETYADATRELTEHIEAVAIRQLSETEQVLAHGTRRMGRPSTAPADADPAVAWVQAPDGFGLLARLRDIGILR